MSDAPELPRGYTEAFAQEQKRIGTSVAFWRALLNTLNDVVDVLNRQTKQGKVVFESPSEHEFQISYLGRELKLAMDHCEQRLFYSLHAASIQSGDGALEPAETGSLSLNRDDDDDGVTLEGDADLQIRSSSMTSSKRSVQQQLAEQLLAKLTMPKWTDDRFDDTP